MELKFLRQQKSGMRNAEKQHLDRLAQLPCALCGASGVHIHHLLEGRVKNRKSGHWTSIPLCPDCHTGSRNGIHGQRVMWNVQKKTELELLGETLEKLYANH